MAMRSRLHRLQCRAFGHRWRVTGGSGFAGEAIYECSRCRAFKKVSTVGDDVDVWNPVARRWEKGPLLWQETGRSEPSC